MGGGDLNLKKSWHPSTRANLEKVYLAEVESQKELKKLEEVKKEKRRERELHEIQQIKAVAGLAVQKERLDWMYSANYCSRGQEVAKTPAVGDEPNKRPAKPVEKRWHIESKIREDPLTKILKAQSGKRNGCV